MQREALLAFAILGAHAIGGDRIALAYIVIARAAANIGVALAIGNATRLAHAANFALFGILPRNGGTAHDYGQQRYNQ